MSIYGKLVVVLVVGFCSCESLAAFAGDLSHFRTEYTDGSRYLIMEALDDDLLHFELAPHGHPDLNQPLYTTPMVAKTDYSGPHSYTALANGIETNDLRVTVASNLCVTTYDKLRHVQLNVICPDNLDADWHGLTINSPESQNVYGLGQYFDQENPDGDWLGRVWDPLFDGYGARLRSFANGANDYSMFPIMYALGQGTQTYALFLDQVYKQMWDFRSAPWKIGTWGQEIRWYMLSGANLPELRRSYMELTGRPPIPPKRSFGLWVSQFGFTSWDEVRAQLADLRAKHFPIEGFAMDLQWFGGTFGDPDHSRMGSLTWDDTKFPDAATEIQDLKNQGINLMLIEEPYVSETLPEYRELSSRGYLVKDCETCGPTYLNYNPWWGRGGMLDFTNPAAADYWHDYRRQLLVNMGIHDHWADLGEPEQYNANAWYYGFPEINKHAHADIHNMYGSLWMASIYRGYQRNQVSQRPFLLSRTGTAGIQRYGVGMWSGDIGTNWGNLRSQMHAQMNMSLSGVDYYGSDAGGFQRNNNVEGGERLYTQWFADSAALDVPVRPHAWNLDKQHYTSPSLRGDPKSNLANLRQRYELFPYYYSLAYQANRYGDPVFPPLVEYFQADPNVRELGSEKLIGRDLVVALAADSNAVTRDVYLPAGVWFDFATNEQLSSTGQTFAGRPLYLDGAFRLPFFARAGAIIPMALVNEQTHNVRSFAGDDDLVDSLKLRIFASPTPTSFDLYEDDGTSFAYQSGQSTLTTFKQVTANDAAHITIMATQGSYHGMKASRRYLVELAVGARLATAVRFKNQNLPLCAGTQAETQTCYENADPGLIRIRTNALPVNQTQDLIVDLAPATASLPTAYFVCENAATEPGTSVYVVGNVPELGSWQPANARRMDSAIYPIWTAKITGLSRHTAIEWKCLKRQETDATHVQWQAGGNNTLQTLETGYAGLTAGTF